MVTSPEKVTLPGGGDLFEYVEEMRKKAASQRTIVPVADIAEADAIAASMAAEGRPVTDDNPLCVFDVAMGEVNVKGAAGWQNTPWTPVTLLNSWGPYVGGGGYYQGLRCRRKDGHFLLSGMIKSGAVGSVIGNVPPAVGYPAYTIMHVNEAHAAGTWCNVMVGNDGLITYRAGPAAPGFANININAPLS
jgi:hypothetical protein